MVRGLTDGSVTMENGNTPDVCLVMGDRRFPRFSVIARHAVDGDL
jgi:hypothetical protein